MLFSSSLLLFFIFFASWPALSLTSAQSSVSRCDRGFLQSVCPESHPVCCFQPIAQIWAACCPPNSLCRLDEGICITYPSREAYQNATINASSNSLDPEQLGQDDKGFDMSISIGAISIAVAAVVLIVGVAASVAVGMWASLKWDLYRMRRQQEHDERDRDDSDSESESTSESSSDSGSDADEGEEEDEEEEEFGQGNRNQHVVDDSDSDSSSSESEDGVKSHDHANVNVAAISASNLTNNNNNNDDDDDEDERHPLVSSDASTDEAKSATSLPSKGKEHAHARRLRKCHTARDDEGEGNEQQPSSTNAGALGSKSLLSSKEEKRQAKAKNRKKEKTEPPAGSECILCYTYRKDTVLLPCGHMISCHRCSDKLIEKGICAMCRTEIRASVRVPNRRQQEKRLKQQQQQQQQAKEEAVATNISV